ncbi:MAG: aminopeptidase [bacterium]|nr:aminopeptidase [bacterium]
MSVADLDESRPLEAARLGEFILATKNSQLLVLYARRLIPPRLRLEAAAAGVRVLSMCGATEETLERAIGVDYWWLESELARARDWLADQREVTVSTSAGTRLSVRLAETRVTALGGLARSPGDIAVLPAGVVGTTLTTGVASGEIVVDGSVQGIGLVAEPIRLLVRNGMLVDISGGSQAGELQRRLQEWGAGAQVVSEVGFGLNPLARYTGSLLEDERVRGSGHLGLGDNTHLGGTHQAAGHLDLSLRRAVFAGGGEVFELSPID